MDARTPPRSALPTGHALALVAVVALAGALPVAVTLVSGWLVGRLESGDAGVARVAVVLAAVFLLSQLGAPLARLVADLLGRRLGTGLQRRLVTAVAAPVGVGPLLEQGVRADLARARAVVAGPATTRDALLAWTGIAVARAQAGACAVVLLWFRPLSALLLAAAYFAFAALLTGEYRRRQLAAYGADASRGRADYLRDLALTGEAAKDVRLFGLADWLLDRHARAWPPAGERGRGAPVAALVVVGAEVAGEHVLVLGDGSGSFLACPARDWQPRPHAVAKPLGGEDFEVLSSDASASSSTRYLAGVVGERVTAVELTDAQGRPAAEVVLENGWFAARFTDQPDAAAWSDYRVRVLAGEEVLRDGPATTN